MSTDASCFTFFTDGPWQQFLEAVACGRSDSIESVHPADEFAEMGVEVPLPLERFAPTEDEW